ncbi:replication initiation regulator SeqA [Pseudocolwellia sp. HL-MZ19]|uniref:replication initiation regulator SeqA n=1 Tax=unclassified Pseudocolwellia TaxID=2848178 RepID=UPI003CF37306
MKNIEIEEDLYQYIASQTQFIGESATSILRRLLLNNTQEQFSSESSSNESTENTQAESINLDNVNEIDRSSESSKVIEAPSFEAENKEIKLTTETIVEVDNGSVFDYLNKEELAMQRGAVGRFLLILGALYRVHTNRFSVVSEIRGRDRLYFSDNLNELTESGSSTKPFQIPESPYWVVTNSNTTRKKMILTKVAVALGYSESESEDIRELL